MTIRLLLADDQELVRGALCALLELQPDFEIVASVGRGDEVVDAAMANHPDVALLDIEMPGVDGPRPPEHSLPSCPSAVSSCSRRSAGRATYAERWRLAQSVSSSKTLLLKSWHRPYVV